LFFLIILDVLLQLVYFIVCMFNLVCITGHSVTSALQVPYYCYYYTKIYIYSSNRQNIILLIHRTTVYTKLPFPKKSCRQIMWHTCLPSGLAGRLQTSRWRRCSIG